MSNHSLLKIRVSDISQEIVELYKKQISERDPMDAGFDLFVPEPHAVRKLQTSNVINHKVQIEFHIGEPFYNAVHGNLDKLRPSYILMTPRSSISKTSLRLANSVGVIDSGYRGDLISKVDNLGTEKMIKAGTSLFQLIVGEHCDVQLVSKFSGTKRGKSGFGSTGNTI